MTEKAQQVISMALELDLAEQKLIVSELLANLDDYDDLHPSWSAEIARRIDELDSGRVTAIPWATARAQILDRQSR